MTTFGQLGFITRYNYFECGFGPYRKFAKYLANLMDLRPGESVIDIGCGSGDSTRVIWEKQSKLKEVVGIDKSGMSIEVAKTKFGYPNKELLNSMLTEELYPPEISYRLKKRDFKRYFSDFIGSMYPYSEKTKFITTDISSMNEKIRKNLGWHQFKHGFGNQVLHWPRKEPGGSIPNLEYEGRCFEEIAKSLESHGWLGFNTTGADFEFDESGWNDKHILEHPAYKTFYNQIGRKIGKPELGLKREYTFNKSDIERVLAENGFRLDKSDKMELKLPREQFIEICLMGAHMQIFEKEQLQIPFEKKQELILNALQYTLEKEKKEIEHRSIIETGAHFVAKKVV